jgi:putative membrane protein
MRGLRIAAAVASLIPMLALADHAEFVEKAAQANMVEVELGKHAAKHAKNGDVQKFGERMAADHAAANRELDSLARSEGFLVPQQLDAESRAKVESIKRLAGLDFDRAYVRAMLDGHVEALALFRSEARLDGPVSEWAETKIPILETHLALAQRVAPQLGIEITAN